MKNLKLIIITMVIMSLTEMVLMLNAQPSSASTRPVRSFNVWQAQLATISEMDVNGAALQQQKQYGYWVKISRNATVRDYPGGKTIVRNGKPVTLKAGQWFHIDPGVGTAKWALGYCCVGGGKGCSRHNSVPGFILRSALSPRTATYKVLPAEPARAAFNLIGVNPTPSKVEVKFVPRVFHHLVTGVRVTLPQNQERRICAREAWFRNDKLHRIGILRKGDSIIVERYTDGAKDDKRRRWAIGRGVGRGIHPRRNHGRVLVASLCS